MDYEAPLMPCGCILLPPSARVCLGVRPRTQGTGMALVAALRAGLGSGPQLRQLDLHSGNLGEDGRADWVLLALGHSGVPEPAP